MCLREKYLRPPGADPFSATSKSLQLPLESPNMRLLNRQAFLDKALPVAKLALKAIAAAALWLLSAMLLTFLLPSRPATLVAAVWVFGTLLAFMIYALGKSVKTAVINSRHFYKIIPVADMLSLLVASGSFIPGIKERTKCPAWAAVVVGLAIGIIGFILASNHRKMESFFFEIEDEEAVKRWQRSLLQEIAFPMGFTRDVSSLVSIYVSAAALILLWPDSYWNWTFAAFMLFLAVSMEACRRLIAPSTRPARIIPVAATESQPNQVSNAELDSLSIRRTTPRVAANLQDYSNAPIIRRLASIALIGYIVVVVLRRYRSNQ